MKRYRVRNGASMIARDESNSRIWRGGEEIPPQFLDYIIKSQFHMLEEIENGSKEKENKTDTSTEEGTEQEGKEKGELGKVVKDRAMKRGRPVKVKE